MWENKIAKSEVGFGYSFKTDLTTTLTHSFPELLLVDWEEIWETFSEVEEAVVVFGLPVEEGGRLSLWTAEWTLFGRWTVIASWK